MNITASSMVHRFRKITMSTFTFYLYTHTHTHTHLMKTFNEKRMYLGSSTLKLCTKQDMVHMDSITITNTNAGWPLNDHQVSTVLSLLRCFNAGSQTEKNLSLDPLRVCFIFSNCTNCNRSLNHKDTLGGFFDFSVCGTKYGQANQYLDQNSSSVIHDPKWMCLHIFFEDFDWFTWKPL